MEILLNGQKIDFTLENEKTVGSIAASLSAWLAGSGFVISSLDVESAQGAKSFGTDRPQDVFTLPLQDASVIDIKTSSVAEFCVEALLETKLAIEELNMQWTESAAASFLQEREPELFNLISAAFNLVKEGQGGFHGVNLQPVIEERICELQNPQKEFLSLEGDAGSIISRLEDFALDMQTGRDARAAETVKIFTSLSAKLLRLVPLLRASGIEFEKLDLQDNFFEEFNQALKEFLSAYESEDTVMCGDIAEYELAPRLKDFYDSVKKRLCHE
jgi:hypothetical protein